MSLPLFTNDATDLPIDMQFVAAPDEKICSSAWLVNLNGHNRGLAASPAYELDQ